MISSSQIKAIIIENDKETQQYLSKLVSDHFIEVQICGYAETVIKSIELIDTINPELIFMDIVLPDGDSFEIFNKIQAPHFEVIFITGTKGNFERALEHFALSYITKPINEQLLIKTIDRYLNLKKRLFNIEKLNLIKDFTNTQSTKIFIQTTNEHILVNTKDIVKIDAYGNYAYVNLSDGIRLLASKGVKYYQDLLPKIFFFRASRSTLINVHFIKSIYKKETIILNNGDKVLVSTRNRSNLVDLIQHLS